MNYDFLNIHQNTPMAQGELYTALAAVKKLHFSLRATSVWFPYASTSMSGMVFTENVMQPHFCYFAGL